jgi:hypothetical protein
MWHNPNTESMNLTLSSIMMKEKEMQFQEINLSVFIDTLQRLAS